MSASELKPQTDIYEDNCVNGFWSDTLTPHLLNQLNIEVAERRVALRTGSAGGPGIVFAGLAQFGTPYAGNSWRYETHADSSDAIYPAARKASLSGRGCIQPHCVARGRFRRIWRPLCFSQRDRAWRRASGLLHAELRRPKYQRRRDAPGCSSSRPLDAAPESCRALRVALRVQPLTG